MMMKKQVVLVLILIGVSFLGSAPAQAAAPLVAEPLTAAVEPTAYNCATATGILSADCQALVAFYNSTNGPSWTVHTDWLVSSTPCTWYGVACTDSRVTELGTGGLLEANNLTGTLPTDLGNLTALQILDLTDNVIGGSIPTQLGNLTALVWLRLNINSLVGSIPTQLGNLTRLEQLELNYNKLTGTIPTQLGNLSSLLFLNLAGNQLTGTVPVQLGSLTNLTLLNVSENQLSGTIPTQLGTLANLQLLDVNTNQLSGTVPVELGNPVGLYQLYLSTNSLTRNLPQNLRNAFLTDFWFNSTSLCEPPDSGFQNWLSSIGDLLRTSVKCAAKASTVTISRSTNDVVLTWTDQAPNTGYEVHLSNTLPYFTPGAGTLQSALPPQPTVTWTAGGAFADANTYYYVVRSKYQDSYNGTLVNDLSADSNRTGKFTFSLTRGG